MTSDRGRRAGTRDAVETAIDLAKHLGGNSWVRGAEGARRSVPHWPEPAQKPPREAQETAQPENRQPL